MTNNLPKPPRKKLDLPKLKKLAQSIREDMTPNNLQQFLNEVLPNILKYSADKGYVQKKDVDKATQSIASYIEDNYVPVEAVREALPTTDELNYAFTALGHGGSIDNPSTYTCHQPTSEKMIELIKQRRIDETTR